MATEYEDLERIYTTPKGTCWTMYRSGTTGQLSFSEHPTFKKAWDSMVMWNRLLGPSTSLAALELVYSASHDCHIEPLRETRES